jgi:metal-responsive CopG/Arc/MetJ family transcriptional regulator
VAKKKTRIIQVPMPEDLVYSLDKLSHERGESRAFILREAAAQYIANADEAERDRRYIESYEKFPEEDEGDWRERLAATVIKPEDFSDWRK